MGVMAGVGATFLDLKASQLETTYQKKAKSFEDCAEEAF